MNKLTHMAIVAVVAGVNFVPWAGAADQAATNNEQPIVLSRFEVNAATTRGYQATSTLAGTRLNTELRDLGASISVLTRELFQDTGATDGATILPYALNMEVGGPNGNFAGGTFTRNRPFTDDARSNPQADTRVRGLVPASLTRDYFLTEIAFDEYNSEAVTINRGANSLLFGIGSPGGVIDQALKKATLGRSFGEVSVRVGERGSHRETIDFNVAAGKRLAARVAGVVSDTQYQQQPAFSKDKRGYVAVQGVLREDSRNGFFGQTILRGNYEAGKTHGTPTSPMPPNDGISAWFSLPKTNYQQYVTLQLREYLQDTSKYIPKVTYDNRDGHVTQFNAGSQIQGPFFQQLGLVYSSPDSGTPSAPGAVPGLHGWQATLPWNLVRVGPNAGKPAFNLWGSIDYIQQIAGFTVPTINDRRVFDNENHLLWGTTNWTEQTFDAGTVVVEQQLFNRHAGVELAFNKQHWHSRYSLPFRNFWADVQVDLNRYLGDGTLNPNVGRPYIRDSSFGDESRIDTTRESRRATAFYDLDLKGMNSRLGWLGRHVVTGLYNWQRIESQARYFDNAWISNGIDLTSVLNGRLGTSGRKVIGMVYVGDSLLDPSITSLSQVRLAPSINVRPPTAGQNYKIMYLDQASGTIKYSDDFEPRLALALDGAKPTYSTGQEIESKVLSWQSHLLDRHVTGLIGWRKDTAKSFDWSGTGLLASGEFDPANFQLKDTPSRIVEGSTLTKSVVLHVPRWRWLTPPRGSELSLHYNVSENFAPASNRYTVYGSPISPPSGDTKEYGFTIEMLQRQLAAKFNWYDTRSMNADVNLGTALNAAAGQIQTWLGNYAAAERAGLPINRIGPGKTGVSVPWTSYAQAYAAIVGLLPKEVQDLRRFRVENGFATSDPILGQSATTTFRATGMEVELVGNLTPDWTVALNVAKQQTIQSETAADVLRLATAVNEKLNSTGIAEYPDAPLAQDQHIFTESYDVSVIRTLQGAAVRDGTVSQEQRKWRLNFVTNYRFREGGLKGVGVGAAVRWQSKAAIGYPLSLVNGVQVPDLSHPFYGPETWNGDVWVSYRRKLTPKIGWTIQLNARNAVGERGQIPVVINPDGQLAVVRNPNPREIFLTNTLSF